MGEFMYVLDTNTLLALQNHYFPDVFVRLWNEINQLIDSNKVISIKEVQAEITSKRHKDYWDQIHRNHDSNFYQDLVDGEEMEFYKIERLDIYHKVIIKKSSEKNNIEWSLQKEWGEG